MDKPKFNPKKYIDAPCEHPIGSEERMKVMETRREYMRPLWHDGDSKLAVPEFKLRKTEPPGTPRTGRIVPGRSERED